MPVALILAMVAAASVMAQSSVPPAGSTLVGSVVFTR